MWFTMLAGTQCTQIVTEAPQNGMKASAKYLFMPQTCPGATFIAEIVVLHQARDLDLTIGREVARVLLE